MGKSIPIYSLNGKPVEFSIRYGNPIELIPSMYEKGFRLPTVAQALELRIQGLEQGNLRSESICYDNSCLTRSMALFRANKGWFGFESRVDYFKIVPDSPILEQRIKGSEGVHILFPEEDYHYFDGTEFLWQGCGANKELDLGAAHKSKLWRAMVENDELLKEYSDLTSCESLSLDYWCVQHMEVQMNRKGLVNGFYGVPIEIGSLDKEVKGSADVTLGNFFMPRKLFFIK